MPKVFWLLILLWPALAAAAVDAPIPAAQAPAHMTVPSGFHVSLFAGEPDVAQPIAFAIDDRQAHVGGGMLFVSQLADRRQAGT